VKRRLPPHMLSPSGGRSKTAAAALQTQVQVHACLMTNRSCLQCGALEGDVCGERPEGSSTSEITNKYHHGGTSRSGPGDENAAAAAAAAKAVLWKCHTCAAATMFCSVCQLSLRGTGIFCMGCGHGGHTHCLKSWAAASAECATGCGCRCVELSLTSGRLHSSGCDADISVHPGRIAGRGSYNASSSGSDEETRSCTGSSNCSGSSSDGSGGNSDSDSDNDNSAYRHVHTHYSTHGTGVGSDDDSDERIDLYSSYFGRRGVEGDRFGGFP